MTKQVSPYYDNLSQDQKDLLYKWDCDNKEWNDSWNLLADLADGGDLTLVLDLIDKMVEMQPTECPHGRDIVGTCLACDEIDAILDGKPIED